MKKQSVEVFCMYSEENELAVLLKELFESFMELELSEEGNFDCRGSICD